MGPHLGDASRRATGPAVSVREVRAPSAPSPGSTDHDERRSRSTLREGCRFARPGVPRTGLLDTAPLRTLSEMVENHLSRRAHRRAPRSDTSRRVGVAVSGPSGAHEKGRLACANRPDWLLYRAERETRFELATSTLATLPAPTKSQPKPNNYNHLASPGVVRCPPLTRRKWKVSWKPLGQARGFSVAAPYLSAGAESRLSTRGNTSFMAPSILKTCSRLMNLRSSSWPSADKAW